MTIWTENSTTERLSLNNALQEVKKKNNGKQLKSVDLKGFNKVFSNLNGLTRHEITRLYANLHGRYALDWTRTEALIRQVEESRKATYDSSQSAQSYQENKTFSISDTNTSEPDSTEKKAPPDYTALKTALKIGALIIAAGVFMTAAGAAGAHYLFNVNFSPTTLLVGGAVGLGATVISGGLAYHGFKKSGRERLEEKQKQEFHKKSNAKQNDIYAETTLRADKKKRAHMVEQRKIQRFTHSISETTHKATYSDTKDSKRTITYIDLKSGDTTLTITETFKNNNEPPKRVYQKKQGTLPVLRDTTTPPLYKTVNDVKKEKTLRDELKYYQEYFKKLNRRKLTKENQAMTTDTYRDRKGNILLKVQKQKNVNGTVTKTYSWSFEKSEPKKTYTETVYKKRRTTDTPSLRDDNSSTEPLGGMTATRKKVVLRTENNKKQPVNNPFTDVYSSYPCNNTKA